MVSINWLGKLMKGFSMPDAGIVGPSSCFCGGNQMIKSLITKRASMTQEDINRVNPGSGIIETEIYGFCYTVAKKVINDIGVFDVDRYPIGGAEEKDFSWRAHKMGYRSYWVKDSYVHHFGNQTFKAMGVKPIEPRRQNDKNFKARQSDENIYIENKVQISRVTIPILMIVLDRYEYTKKALTSVLENTNYPFKLFIFDNGSEPKVGRYLDRITDSRVEIFHSRENLGLVPAMNMFFDRYKDCKYVAKVDNDTVVPAGWLEKLKDVMDALPLFTVQADHYLAMPFKIDENQDFYNHCYGVEFNGEMLYFYKNSGGTGQIIRRDLIDKPLAKLSDTKGKGGLSGWCNMQVAKYKKYPSAFYTGVWIDRLDQSYTNKYKEVSDYPAYDQMIAKMRPWGLGYAKMNIGELEKLKEEMKVWYSKNACGVY
jgi:GT2 family glycosyltransferase